LDEDNAYNAAVEYGVYRRVRTRPTYIYQLFGRIRLPQPVQIPTLLATLVIGALLLIIWLALPINMTGVALPVFVFVVGLAAVAFEKLHWDGRRADRWLASVMRWCFASHEYVRFKPARASGDRRLGALARETGRGGVQYSWKTPSRPVSPVVLIRRKKRGMFHVWIRRRG
jgi:hypothetical protein